MSKTIKIIVPLKGETKIETHGFTGQSCKDASKFIEKALGQKTDDKLTQDYYATNQNSIQTKVQQ